MARKPRIEYKGAAYHVMSRGNRGADIFVEEADRLLFLDTLDEVCGRMAWEILAVADGPRCKCLTRGETNAGKA